MARDREEADRGPEHEERPRATDDGGLVARLRALMRGAHSAPPVVAEPTARMARWRVIEVHDYQ